MIKSKKEISIFQGIRSLIPDAKLYVENNSWDKIHWHDEREQPSRSDIETKIKELQEDYDSKQYQRDREFQYPSITDVVVALAEKEEGDDTMWKIVTALRQKVKSDIPKPT